MLIHINGDEFFNTFTGMGETIRQGHSAPTTRGRKNKAKGGRWRKKVIQWRRAVLARDKNTCQGCGAKAGLQVHHHARFSEIDITSHDFIFNGVTVCHSCHSKLHPELPEGFRAGIGKYVVKTASK